MNKKKYLKINASEVAACIGSNIYISKDVMVLKIWKRVCSKSLEKALKRNKLKMIDMKKIKSNNITRIYIQKFNETLNNRNNGLNNESSIIKTYQTINNVLVKDNNRKSYRIFINKNYDKLLLHNIIVSGLVDGIVNNNYIIEVK